MKITTFLFTLLFGALTVQAQEPNKNDGHHEENQQPYYVIVYEDKSVELADTDVKEEYKDLKFIDPNWINKLEVLKGKTAKKRYGRKGKDGVVVVYLKEDKFEEFPAEIRNSFKDN